MATDPEKLILLGNLNSLKNEDTYTDTLTFPTTIGASATATETSTIVLNDNPVFTQFSAKFLEFIDAEAGLGTAEWYSQNVSGNLGVAVHVTAPSGNVGYIKANVVPVINSNVVTVTGTIVNPYSNSITIAALSIPFSFVEYTLAN